MTNPLVSVISPVAIYHDHLLPQAAASVEAQTVPCEHIIIHDRDSRGAGWARNRGLERVSTPFVVFLDADDTIHPDFVEKTLRAYQPGHYVYTDWKNDDKIIGTDEPWTLKGDWHVLTALIPTSAMQAIGGFDEEVAGAEDTLMWWALTRTGICGIRVPEPLFTYGAGGRRAKAFIGTEAHQALMAKLVERYKDMGCCGDDATALPPAGEKQPGDVLAQAIWGGNRIQRGFATGRFYPRTGNGKTVWVAPADIEAAPHLWRKVAERPIIPTPPKPDVDVILNPQRQAILTEPAHGVEQIGKRLWPEAKTAPEPKVVEPAKVRPDVAKVAKLAKRGRRTKGG